MCCSSIQCHCPYDICLRKGGGLLPVLQFSARLSIAGPNINPACPPPNHRYGDADIQASDGEVAKEVVVVTDGHDSGSSDSGVVLDRRSEASSPMSKPKSGKLHYIVQTEV